VVKAVTAGWIKSIWWS